MLAMWETAVVSDIASVIGPLVTVTTEFEKKTKQNKPPAVLELCYWHFHTVTLNLTGIGEYMMSSELNLLYLLSL